jgi:peptidoglycan/LPS O-acetylase OafA/YrhL
MTWCTAYLKLDRLTLDFPLFGAGILEFLTDPTLHNLFPQAFNRSSQNDSGPQVSKPHLRLHIVTKNIVSIAIYNSEGKIKSRIRSLDGLRGVAITMVLLAHTGGTFPSGCSKWLYPLRGFFNGEYGVEIFFVLSGYLITSILIREYDAIGKVDIKAFYCRRMLRIFPAFYLFLFLISMLDWMHVLRISGTDLALAGTHLINYGQAIILLFKIHGPVSPDYWFVGQFWSLSMEEQFYWIWPLTLLFLLRTRWYGILVAVILAMPLIRFSSYYLFPGLRGQLMMMLHTASDGIFSGCILAICLAWHPHFSQKLLLCPWAVAGLAFYIYGVDPFVGDAMPRGFGVVLGATLVIGAIALIVANVVLQERRTWYHQLLESGVLVFLGRTSYSIYLWQQIFLTPLNTTFFGKWPINLAAALVTGWLSYRCVELPFIRLKGKYFPSHGKATTPSAAPAAVPSPSTSVASCQEGPIFRRADKRGLE